MGKVHFRDFFARAFKGKKSFCVQKSNPAYSYIARECPNSFSKDESGNFIISADREELANVREAIVRIKSVTRRVEVGSNEYEYFLNEYRQNSPMRDLYGNIVLNDEMVTFGRKM